MWRRFLQLDWALFSSALLLLGVGLIALYGLSANAGTDFFVRQAVFASVSIAVMLSVAFIDYRQLERGSTPLYFATIGALIAVLIVGQTVRGTAGWISLGFFQVQPVEFAKIVLILFLACFIKTKKSELGEWARLIGSLILSAVMIFLVLQQPDLGSSLTLAAIWLGMIAVSGLRFRHFAVLIVLGFALSASAWLFLAPYQKDRINTFLHPELDPKGSGYNVLQAMVAVGSGGMFGKGLGSGSQSQLSFLPERHTDFLFAVVAEELGLVGALLILFLYGVILYRIKRIADMARDNLGYLLAVGALLFFLVHIVVNIGMNMGLLPVTGLPAPLLSYGGSSLLATFLLLGILQSVYRHRGDSPGFSITLERQGLNNEGGGMRY